MCENFIPQKNNKKSLSVYTNPKLYRKLPSHFFYIDQNNRKKLFPYLDDTILDDYKINPTLPLQYNSKEKLEPVQKNNKKHNYKRKRTPLQKAYEEYYNKLRKILTPTQYIYSLSLIIKQIQKPDYMRYFILKCYLQQLILDNTDYAPLYFTKDVDYLAECLQVYAENLHEKAFNNIIYKYKQLYHLNRDFFFDDYRNFESLKKKIKEQPKTVNKNYNILKIKKTQINKKFRLFQKVIEFDFTKRWNIVRKFRASSRYHKLKGIKLRKFNEQYQRLHIWSLKRKIKKKCILERRPIEAWWSALINGILPNIEKKN